MNFASFYLKWQKNNTAHMLITNYSWVVLQNDLLLMQFNCPHTNMTVYWFVLISLSRCGNRARLCKAIHCSCTQSVDRLIGGLFDKSFSKRVQWSFFCFVQSSILWTWTKTRSEQSNIYISLKQIINSQ